MTGKSKSLAREQAVMRAASACHLCALVLQALRIEEGQALAVAKSVDDLMAQWHAAWAAFFNFEQQLGRRAASVDSSRHDAEAGNRGAVREALQAALLALVAGGLGVQRQCAASHPELDHEPALLACSSGCSASVAGQLRTAMQLATDLSGPLAAAIGGVHAIAQALASDDGAQPAVPALSAALTGMRLLPRASARPGVASRTDHLALQGCSLFLLHLLQHAQDSRLRSGYRALGVQQLPADCDAAVESEPGGLLAADSQREGAGCDGSGTEVAELAAISLAALAVQGCRSVQHDGQWPAELVSGASAALCSVVRQLPVWAGLLSPDHLRQVLAAVSMCDIQHTAAERMANDHDSRGTFASASARSSPVCHQALTQPALWQVPGAAAAWHPAMRAAVHQCCASLLSSCRHVQGTHVADDSMASMLDMLRSSEPISLVAVSNAVRALLDSVIAELPGLCHGTGSHADTSGQAQAALQQLHAAQRLLQQVLPGASGAEQSSLRLAAERVSMMLIAGAVMAAAAPCVVQVVAGAELAAGLGALVQDSCARVGALCEHEDCCAALLALSKLCAACDWLAALAGDASKTLHVLHTAGASLAACACAKESRAALRSARKAMGALAPSIARCRGAGPQITMTPRLQRVASGRSAPSAPSNGSSVQPACALHELCLLQGICAGALRSTSSKAGSKLQAEVGKLAEHLSLPRAGQRLEAPEPAADADKRSSRQVNGSEGWQNQYDGSFGNHRLVLSSIAACGQAMCRKSGQHACSSAAGALAEVRVCVCKRALSPLRSHQCMKSCWGDMLSLCSCAQVLNPGHMPTTAQPVQQSSTRL